MDAGNVSLELYNYTQFKLYSKWHLIDLLPEGWDFLSIIGSRPPVIYMQINHGALAANLAI